MSTKDLFKNSTIYVAEDSQKNRFSDVESYKNVDSTLEKDKQYVPQVDFSLPENFCFYGSAELYYSSAISRIFNFYPYDGSRNEKNKFIIDSFDIDRYFFDNLYPKTNGYVKLSDSYITIKGGPNKTTADNTKDLFGKKDSQNKTLSNIYNDDIYTFEGLESDYGSGTRQSNLQSDFSSLGTTLEFWLKSDSLTSNQLQTVFHLTNSFGQSFSLFASGTTGSPFFLSYTSGSDAVTTQRVNSTATTSSLEAFHHYAFTFISASSGLEAKSYIDGEHTGTTTFSPGIGDFNQNGILAYIGSGSSGTALSASIDEFRFWKVKRTHQDIGLNWFGNIDGGTNSEVYNTTLGVYYKFNEGITNIASQDSVVLDYSGRVTNGDITGYDASYTRTTASAFVESGLVVSEEKDPIIYSNHPDVSSLLTDYTSRGKNFDYGNNTSFIRYMPSWVIEEHDDLENKNLKHISHIIGSYFDLLFLRISDLENLKTNIYPEPKNKPVTYARALPASLGLDTPDLFVDSDLIESILNKNKNKSFSSNIEDTKNLIYLNLYRNLTNIFKAKGTKESIRNVMRAFGVSEQVLYLTTIMNNNVEDLSDKRTQQLVNNNFIDFNTGNGKDAVLFVSGSGISGSNTTGYESVYGASYEFNYRFPLFNSRVAKITRNFITSSLFGIHKKNYSNDTTILNPSFNCYLVRDREHSKNGQFVLSSSLLTSNLASPFFQDIYDNENWLISVRVKPENYPYGPVVSGGANSNYTVLFNGYNMYLDTVVDSFEMTSSVTSANMLPFLTASKGLYVGAQRENVTGTLQNNADYLLSKVSVWSKYIENSDLLTHARDYQNSGIANFYENISPVDTNNSKVKNKDTLILDWQFTDVTTTDSSGEFTSLDYSSGSISDIGKYSLLFDLGAYKHTCVGKFFTTDSTEVVQKTKINVMNQLNVEGSISDEQVKILSKDDQLFDIKDLIPSYHYFLEKSLYRAISSEMMNFFAGVVDFNNLLGNPVNQYRQEYKELEKLRDIFFSRVTSVTDVEKFINYYKWFDDAISSIVQQLIPASSDLSPSIANTIEPHALERSKYQYRAPYLGTVSATEGVAFGAEELRYSWNKGHRPLSGLEKNNADWWKLRANRASDLSSGDASVDNNKQIINNVITSDNSRGGDKVFNTAKAKHYINSFKYRTLSKNAVTEVKRQTEVKGGVNFEHNKSIHYTQTALHPAGPINREGGIFVPRNVLLAFAEDFVALEDIDDLTDEPAAKIKRNVLVQHGRDWEDGIGYKNVKSSFAFPFNIVSSSVRSGYNAEVISSVTASIELTNLHNDVYGPDMEKPMQGPFTEYAVGGHQSRHVKLNTGNDNYLNRPEAWKVLMGMCVGVPGALGMVGADYPFPEANAVGATPYPMTGAQKATLYRDELAKRPVNIRNIQHTTGSTILGNFNQNYEVVHTVGGFSNPRAFIDEQPTIPTKAIGADAVRTILDIERGQNGHFTFIDDYNSGYLTGSGNHKNKTVIVSRFSAPGSFESMAPGFKDIRSGELSVYNTIPYRNMTTLRPFQGVTSSIVSQNTGIRNFDHTGRAFGLANLAARHSEKFFRDSVFQSSPGASDDAFTESPSFHKVHRNNKITPIDKNIPTTQQKFDNLNVSHQIPRSDRQYSWITSSIIQTNPGDPRYSGFMQTDSPIAPYYDLAGTLVTFFDYVTGSTIQPNGIFQNTTRLNIRVTDPVFSSSNTLGSGSIEQTPLSPGLWIKRRGLRNLLMRRGDTYGWNWRAHRMQDHPILHIEQKQNKLTVLKNSEIKQFRLPPVSFKGRPAVANITIGNSPITFQATHNNEKIYFNERELNDLQFESKDKTVTPFDEIIELSIEESSGANWLLYSQNVFPSLRNEGAENSNQRTGYDNKFWRDDRIQRTLLGSTSDSDTTKGINSLGAQVSQSSWILDAPDDFDSRPDAHRVDSTPIVYHAFCNAGELQNQYLMAPAGSTTDATSLAATRKTSALFSRKHFLTSPNSVVSRTGFAKTGSLTNSFTDQIKQFGGEAKWEAGAKALVQIKSGSVITTSSSPSQPWFNDYNEYKEELRLMAKGYGIVPEFRISEHVSDYITTGLFNKTKQDEFEIPGTEIDSQTDNFYKDYSNSDFLKEFADIKDKSQLNASEIMLTCKAAIRFNPYKGFYPAQRTVDLVSQFSSSFAKGITQIYDNGSEEVLSSFDPELGISRPLLQPLFAPGILYNSIKSGIAVDYPVCNVSEKFVSYNFDADNNLASNNCIMPKYSGSSGFFSFASGRGKWSPDTQFWDLRVPFETIIDPGKYIDKFQFIDFEANPSASADTSAASLDTSVSDEIYSLMAKNFFGQSGEFFLKGEGFTKISSDLIQDGLRFKTGEVYGARLKIRKSHNGKRFYNNERDFQGSTGSASFFSNIGALTTNGLSDDSELERLIGSFPLPQDPAHNPEFKETFTMYSRPTSFGPAISGRSTKDGHSDAFLSGTLDAIEGYNWAYTPPYYHGESWVDFIFRPQTEKEYSLEDILSEIETVFWRADPGEQTGSIGVYSSTSWKNNRTLISTQLEEGGPIVTGSRRVPIYGGSAINQSAMQLPASINLFGVERVAKKRKDKFGNTILDQNELAGKKWVIQPKWETPMLNFADVSEDAGKVSYPSNLSESVPRGIWHQFGEIPTDPNTGIFLEFEDISQDWLKNHYDVVKYSSSYNNYEPITSGSTAARDFKSLSKLFGFDRSQKKSAGKVRLGEIADKRDIYEAIVAIPYVIEADNGYSSEESENNIDRKKFISISRERFNSSLKEVEGSKSGDSLDVAGESIRTLAQQMKRYILPPKFDFINFPSVDPFVMYFFEFKYELDRDDLSYIWQNIAPRDYKKITFQQSRVAHKLSNNELLDEPDIMDNKNLRWMVFKVKQKAKSDYFDLVATQAGEARKITNLDKPETDKDDEYIKFNWPYDYLSFVELINVDVSALYKK